MRVEETLVKVRRGPWSFRVWRKTRDGVSPAVAFARDRSDVVAVLPDGPDFDPFAIADDIASLQGVSAVQVEDDDGCGFAIFPDWP